MAKRKTPRQRAIDKRKRAIRRRVKKARTKLVRRVKKTKRTIKRTRKKLVRRRKKVVRIAKRRTKKIKTAARKRIRKFKKDRDKAKKAQYRRSNISQADPSLLGGFTADRTQAGGDVAYLADHGNDEGASKAGEPPKKRTGKGQSAIKAQLISHKKKKSNISSRTYVDKRTAAYMAMWEYRNDGEARPFLRPSLENNKTMLGDIIGKSLKRKLRAAR